MRGVVVWGGVPLARKHVRPQMRMNGMNSSTHNRKEGRFDGQRWECHIAVWNPLRTAWLRWWVTWPCAWPSLNLISFVAQLQITSLTTRRRPRLTRRWTQEGSVVSEARIDSSAPCATQRHRHRRTHARTHVSCERAAVKGERRSRI
jgi:hypothetical protein